MVILRVAGEMFEKSINHHHRRREQAEGHPAFRGTVSVICRNVLVSSRHVAASVGRWRRMVLHANTSTSGASEGLTITTRHCFYPGPAFPLLTLSLFRRYASPFRPSHCDDSFWLASVPTHTAKSVTETYKQTQNGQTPGVGSFGVKVALKRSTKTALHQNAPPAANRIKKLDRWMLQQVYSVRQGVGLDS